MIQEYRIVNEQSGGERTIPHPTSVIVDRDGIVRHVWLETDYKVRPPTPELVSLLRELPE